MKTIKNSFYKKITFEKFLNAYYKSIIHKANKLEVLIYSIDLEINIYNLMSDVFSFRYQTGHYREFTIYEPKKRVIRSLPFKDRIVQTWYIECFIKPYFLPRFIYDSYACIENKGVHKGVARLKYFMNCMKNEYKKYYIIKLDIHKFFDSINKEILFNILSKYISDKYLLKFSYELIFSYKYCGLPIGNYASQYFANIYLNELDYYIKNNLHQKYYLRYMDDFVILVNDKCNARYIYDLIEIFVNNKLKLELNPKSKYYPNNLGCIFLGYEVYENYILVKKKNIKKIRGKIKIWNKLYENNILDHHKFILSFNSFLGYISHANSYLLKNKIVSEIKFYNNIVIK